VQTGEPLKPREIKALAIEFARELVFQNARESDVAESSEEDPVNALTSHFFVMFDAFLDEISRQNEARQLAKRGKKKTKRQRANDWNLVVPEIPLDRRTRPKNPQHRRQERHRR
jgi:hypothetical protein